MGIYTNGILAISTNSLTSLDSVSTNRFYLGKSLFPTDPPLNGSIDEFRIYNAALSAGSNIRQLQKRPGRRSQINPAHHLTLGGIG